MGPKTFSRRKPADRPASRTGQILLLFLLALPPAVVAFLALLGVGAARGGQPAALLIAAVALALLPALGLSGLLGNRPAAMVAALLLWSLAVLIGLPLYFPGERAVAIARGASWVGSGAEEEPSLRSLRFGQAVDRILGGDRAPPLPAAPAVPVEKEATPEPPDGGDQLP